MFSKSCKYGIRAVLFLCHHSDEQHKHGVKSISEELKIPQHFLAKILQELSRNKLVSSAKGPTGGFYMSESNSNATLLDVIKSIDGPDTFSNCVLGLTQCNAENPCILHDEMVNYRSGLLGLLEKESIRETCARLKNEKIKI